MGPMPRLLLEATQFRVVNRSRCCLLLPLQAKEKEQELMAGLRKMFDDKGASPALAGGRPVASFVCRANFRSLLTLLHCIAAAVPFDMAWRVEVKIRGTGTSLGTTDAVRSRRARRGGGGGSVVATSASCCRWCCRCCTSSHTLECACLYALNWCFLCVLQYYFSPAGKRYRSRMEVCGRCMALKARA